MNWQTFSQVAFALRGHAALLLWQGLLGGVAMSLLGGALPALRAARLSVTDGLREL